LKPKLSLVKKCVHPGGKKVLVPAQRRALKQIEFVQKLIAARLAGDIHGRAHCPDLSLNVEPFLLHRKYIGLRATVCAVEEQTWVTTLVDRRASGHIIALKRFQRRVVPTKSRSWGRSRGAAFLLKKRARQEESCTAIQPRI